MGLLRAQKALRLRPDTSQIQEFKRDYEDMQVMLFGDAPAFDAILTVLRKLEVEISSLSSMG